MVFCLCPVLGGLPLVAWLTRALAGKNLETLGTGNISVSAAFYHGGRGVGILAACAEASKGVVAVLLARSFFPNDPLWEVVAIIALVMGRYWVAKSAGTTNVFWAIFTHDPIGAVVIVFFALVSFTLVRERILGRLISLFWLVLILAVRQSSQNYGVAVLLLALLMAWIYARIPDDLSLETLPQQQDSRALFRFFRGNQSMLTLKERLDPDTAGPKAATLATLIAWGYDVPEGWVLPPGDDPQPLILSLEPTPDIPLIVRSSALGEDTATASAAGQYITIPDVTNTRELATAILRCQTAYNSPRAIQYRRHHRQGDRGMAVLVQRQIKGVYAGVAFSRDPVNQYRDAVLVEAVAGGAEAVVSGQVTPEQYRAYFPAAWEGAASERDGALTLEGAGTIPPGIVHQVAQCCRALERRYHGVPQDVEWSYDGETLWILQCRPITTLTPIWTRKIAAEVIPGAIRPLTWSINQPLTCGVWGKLFTLGLGGATGSDQYANGDRYANADRNRTQGLDFDATATLHFSHAYFNATLLGEIFRRMGLPPESLEFLTRGEKFSKPPLLSTLKNLPGLWRLLQREWHLPDDFAVDARKWFKPTLQQLQVSPEGLSPDELLSRVDLILSTLKRATYYNILAPLSVALRQAVLRVDSGELDSQRMPEVASVRSLVQLAEKSRNLLPMGQLNFDSCPSLFAYLAEMPDGQGILTQFNAWLAQYGYLSEVATDIAVPRWQENPRPMRELFARCVFDPLQRNSLAPSTPPGHLSWGAKWVQHRLDLKGEVAEIYNRLLAHLRWTILALEKQWLAAEYLQAAGDLFFLTLPEITAFVEQEDAGMTEAEKVKAVAQLQDYITYRQRQYAQDCQRPHVPFVVYGQPSDNIPPPAPATTAGQTLQGMGVSGGIVEGVVKVVRSLDILEQVQPGTILVIPYSDAGWSPLLAIAHGIIAEVGGSLSHGAILAREYGIPAVFAIPGVMHALHDGQRVRLDGQGGTVVVLG